MPVLNTDLVVYGSAVMADDDTVVNVGGAIDTSTRLVFVDIAPSGTVEMLSSNNADTMTVTLYGRKPDGSLVSETQTLTGTAVVAFATTWERILKGIVTAAHAGTVQVRKFGGGTTLLSFEPGVNQIRRPFYNAFADAAGGVAKTYYEKCFIKNNNASIALTNAQIAKTGETRVTFALEPTLNGVTSNGAGNNRQVAPTGFTFDSNTKDVSNSKNHSPGAAQGIWLELSLAAGDAASKTSITLTETGQTIA